MPKNTNRVNEEISKCINKLLLKEPFYAHIISSTVRKITNEIETAAVGLKEDVIFFMVNDTFFLKELKTTNERVAVIKHEILHLVFRHLFRMKNIDDLEIYNIAADIVVNQYIGQNWKLPENAVTIELFPDFNLDIQQNVEYYYTELNTLFKSLQKKLSKLDKEFPDKDKIELSDSEKKLLDIYGKKTHGNHQFWSDSNLDNTSKNNDSINSNSNFDPSSIAQLTLNKQIQSAFERISSKNKDELSDEIKQEIDIICQELKPTVDWKRVLKLFSGQSSKTKIYHTVKRVSKRFGTRPGIKIKKQNKIAIIVDTSGSIDSEILNQFFFEIQQIYRLGTDVLVIECDDRVGNVYTYSKQTILEISGGGCTDYDPAFEYINQNKNLKINSCIYLTDGYAEPPKIKPRCNLLYIITPDGLVGDHLKFGKYIQMRN